MLKSSTIALAAAAIHQVFDSSRTAIKTINDATKKSLPQWRIFCAV